MSSQVGWRARRCVGHHHRVGPGPCGYVLGTRGTFYEAAGAFAHNFTQNEPPATNLNSKFKSEVRKKSSTPPLPYTYKKTGPGHPLWIFRFGPVTSLTSVSRREAHLRALLRGSRNLAFLLILILILRYAICIRYAICKK